MTTISLALSSVQSYDDLEHIFGISSELCYFLIAQHI